MSSTPQGVIPEREFSPGGRGAGTLCSTEELEEIPLFEKEKNGGHFQGLLWKLGGYSAFCVLGTPPGLNWDTFPDR